MTTGMRRPRATGAPIVATRVLAVMGAVVAAAACGGGSPTATEAVAPGSTSRTIIVGCEPSEDDGFGGASGSEWIVDVVGASRSPTTRPIGELVQLEVGSVLRPSRLGVDPPTGTVAAQMGRGATEKIDAALARGDRVVTVLDSESGYWIAATTVSLGRSGVLAAIGGCEDRTNRQWQQQASARSTTPADAFLAWATTPLPSGTSTTTKVDLVEEWWAMSPAARQVDRSDTPKAILRDLRYVTVTVTVPPDVLDGQTTLCARTALAVGSCSILGPGVGTHLSLNAYYPAGASDLSVELVTGSAAGVPSHVIGVVPAPRNVAVALSGPSASQLVVADQVLATSGSPDTVIPSDAPPSSIPAPTR